MGDEEDELRLHELKRTGRDPRRRAADLLAGEPRAAGAGGDGGGGGAARVAGIGREPGDQDEGGGEGEEEEEDQQGPSPLLHCDPRARWLRH